ncbi:molybdate ABC transporter permease subunit [Wansuia hejianensis]|uniref:Molybdenum transport system permease n=1 Tax=Wansuia hejianensis TaxID=2763667 RepID=A0A926IHS7_9FIRM|nr:molybdate ABC transporter permease subunit [Wansuia hejianensis]MBC8590997.1 molybdate ABC transporter permease subunit [Wansuia hejianensis]
MNYSPLLISLKAAIISTAINFFLGIYSAFLVSRTKKLKGIMDGILTLPLVLPPTVVGFFLLILLGKNSIIGRTLLRFNTSIMFSQAATIISATVVSFPLMYRTARGAFEQLDKDIINVARTLGLSEHKIFRKIILPNSFSNIMAGTILTFARSLGEFGATIMIAGNIPGKTQTMSVVIYSAVQAGNRHLAYNWVILMASISLVIMILMNKFETNKTYNMGKGGNQHSLCKYEKKTR